MLLRYLNKGVRTNAIWSGRNSDLLRGNWEFMAVTEGRARLISPGSPDGRPLGNRLWMLPPTSRHTWRVKEGEACTVYVIHFASLPSVMDHFVTNSKPACIGIGGTEVAKISAIYDEVLPYYRRPRLSSVLWFEKAALELCILMERSLKLKEEPDGASRGALIVQQAALWFREHVSEGATVSDVCSHFHISPSQLRRMFEKSLKKSPKQVFAELALDEACRLMSTSALSMKEIGGLCGFAGFSQFYRAFAHRYNMSPTTWRKNNLYGNLGIRAS